MFTRALRLILATVFAVYALAGTFSGATAQVTEVVTDTTGQVIGYDQSWSEIGHETDAETGLEFVTFEHAEGGRLGFVFSARQLDQAQARDALLEGVKTNAEGYTVIDSGQYDNIAYELSHFQDGDTKLGVFVLVTTSDAGTTIVSVTGEADWFKDAVGRVQGGVTLNDVQVLRGIDGASLQTQLQVSDATEVTTAADVPEMANESETNAEPADTSGSGGEFSSDAFGYTVTFGAPWSVGNQGIGEMDLMITSPLTLVSFQGVENAGATGADFEMLLTDTFVETLGPGGELIGTYSNQDSAVFVGTSEGMILIQEIIVVSDSVAVIVTAVADGASDPETVIANLRQITVNGIPLLSPVG